MLLFLVSFNNIKTYKHIRVIIPFVLYFKVKYGNYVNCMDYDEFIKQSNNRSIIDQNKSSYS